MFLVLMVALLPLGIVAVTGTVQTIRSAEVERVGALRLAAAQGANRLLGRINTDRAALRLVVNSLDEDPRRTIICQRAGRQLTARGKAIAFAVFDMAGRRLCWSGTADWADLANLGQIAEIGQRGRALLVVTHSARGGARAVVSYGADQLADMTDIPIDGGDYLNISLSSRTGILPLATQGESPGEAYVDHASAPLNLGGLEFNMNMKRPPVAVLRLAATMLPIVMWCAAAGVGWWAINRFLVRPLIELNRHVAAYQPGTLLDPAPSAGQLAHEITMLGNTFREISRDVAAHEAQLADALVQQQALTREVHHRVKNNLQIIASLINLHSRAAPTPDAAAAYASIQRRVDALSVVHRNNYAATERSHGIDAMALISELGSALRAGAPLHGRGLPIKVECGHFYLSQDIAVPTAFLVTELVELVLLSGVPSPVCIALHRAAEGGMAELSVTSDALRPSPEVDRLLADRFGRVLNGLSRQLRATLSYDPVGGRYGIFIPLCA